MRKQIGAYLDYMPLYHKNTLKAIFTALRVFKDYINNCRGGGSVDYCGTVQ